MRQSVRGMGALQGQAPAVQGAQLLLDSGDPNVHTCLDVANGYICYINGKSLLSLQYQ